MPVAVILFLQWLSAGSSPDAMKELRTLLERTEAAPPPMVELMVTGPFSPAIPL